MLPLLLADAVDICSMCDDEMHLVRVLDSRILNMDEGISTAQAKFDRDGFLIVRGMAPVLLRQEMLSITSESIDPPLGPLEYEAEVEYPGAPAHIDAPGGKTPRRLLNAYSRARVFREWAHYPAVVKIIRQLMSVDQLMLSQNHHNCIMTKLPGFSSETGWHQDIRYWSFDRPELINVWLALGDEYPENGGMLLIPGSHKLEVDRGRFDAAMFLRPDLAENAALLSRAVSAELSSGDVLIFHCRTFHAAENNTTQSSKYSLVYSYRAADNLPIPQTRSARLVDICV